MNKDGTNDDRTVHGACRFCGQVKMVTMSEDEWLERIRKTNKAGNEIADDLATEQCTCNQGSDWRADNYVIDQCRQNIEDMFREEYGEIADALQQVIDPVYHQRIKKVTYTTPEHGTATMTRSGGNMKLKFTQKHETEMTASY